MHRRRHLLLFLRQSSIDINTTQRFVERDLVTGVTGAGVAAPSLEGGLGWRGVHGDSAILRREARVFQGWRNMGTSNTRIDIR